MPLINIQLNTLSRAVSKVSVHKYQSPPCSYKCGVLESTGEFITVVFMQHWRGSETELWRGDPYCVSCYDGLPILVLSQREHN